MAKRSRDSMVRLGPCIVPNYPLKAFSRLPGGIAWDLWKLCGPTVERNLTRPLWAQFCAVYYEGLNHGANAMREKLIDSGEYVEPIPWLP